MRPMPFLAGGALVLAVAGVAMAASPSTPTTTPPKSPAATTSAPKAATPKSSTSTPAAAAAAATTWSAAIKPIDVTTGTATVAQAANGTGTLTVKLAGLRPDVRWTVDVDGGALGAPDSTRREIAFRSGMGVEKVSTDTVRVQLTKAEMARFLRDRSSVGVVVHVSDGMSQSAATFSAS